MRIALIALTALLISSCSGPQIGEKITAAPQESRTTVSTTTTTSSVVRPTLGPASDIKAVDWRNSKLPAGFCDVQELVQFRDAEGTGSSGRWGQVHLFAAYDPKRVVYGDIDGDGNDEAAVDVGCDNGGGTASGQLAFGYAVVTVRNGSLEVVGEVSSTTMRDDSPHVPLLSEPRFDKGSITVKESWYRPSDATCCPSGEARTTWRLSDSTLKPDPAVQVS
ncbi:hypothetical protein [Lentzea aerocolonigenes]|uniref:hypothetical protein n=1 Tax=Lentzea aerocolonigenes TaxID=68170 RepID=UPI0006913575|nr:hypothetical protein [Lentzea aerocolonigenes]MCP2241692.1 LppP/LprE lipoprotein [Lentzea aerocolonigenes]